MRSRHSCYEGCTNLWYKRFPVQKKRVTSAIFKKYLQCVLAAKILTVYFVVCTLGRFRHVGSDHSLVRLRQSAVSEQLAVSIEREQSAQETQVKFSQHGSREQRRQLKLFCMTCEV
jgi:hypothetical protein